MEVNSLTQAAIPARRGSARLLRIASDERLIALTRRGNSSAYELLVERYQARLLAFCRHMLGSREDAEDVLQEVFVAAFNAILADERAINVRPWLYRIARNRSLNHLRRATATGVDSMDIFLADHGQSVTDRILQRESFRSLLGDIGQLAETQRTALLLREIDALSYEHIAEVMDTTVPSVKSLLVRARVALAEAAEARKLSCSDVREQLGEEAEGLIKLQAPARRHLRDCDRCRSFRKQLKQNERTLSAMLPFGGLALLHRLLAGKIGSGTGAGGASYVAGGSASGGTAGAGLAAGGAAGGAAGISGFGGLGGLAGIGTGAVATKAVAGLATAALITAGAVVSERQAPSHPVHHAAIAASPATISESAPAAAGKSSQTITSLLVNPGAIARNGRHVQGTAGKVRAATHSNSHGAHKLQAAAQEAKGKHSPLTGTADKSTGKPLLAGKAAGSAPSSVSGALASKPGHVHASTSGPTSESLQTTSSTTQLQSEAGTHPTHSSESSGTAHSAESTGNSEAVEVLTSSTELRSGEPTQTQTTTSTSATETASCTGAPATETSSGDQAQTTGGTAVSCPISSEG